VRSRISRAFSFPGLDLESHHWTNASVIHTANTTIGAKGQSIGNQCFRTSRERHGVGTVFIRTGPDNFHQVKTVPEPSNLRPDFLAAFAAGTVGRRPAGKKRPRLSSPLISFVSRVAEIVRILRRDNVFA